MYAALRAAGLAGPAFAGPAAGRYILAALAALGLAASVLVVSGLLVSTLLSGFGSTTAGRSTYFGASAAGGASADFDASVALAGAGAVFVSMPPSDKLRSPACAVAEAKTNPAIKMNLRMLKSPLEVEAETMQARRFFM
ncbi:hypothetical protein IVB30_00395 [Bradyrhizobium sp. 200]|uniref:hypothetical protein n=1 Tax=Bradyrhizobium sp. 200 TaxID=2782665 RepID=UPI001FFFAE79|nr:hypothetical protein [Bradyrhizobium sp. 200]UPJ49935.1 hypothetical protein IVB30_00395 [Bradyrhizobium sp. 200]